MAISSPNRIIWQYFQCLRRIINRANIDTDDEEKKQDVALCIFMAITIVEAFINIYFRIIVEEQGFAQYKALIVKDLKSHKTIDYKIRNWPRRIFGKTLNFSEGIPKQFLELKRLRNELMHFKSSHEAMHMPGVSVYGLADTSALDDLDISKAFLAHDIAEGMLIQLFRLRGIAENEMSSHIHLWTGRII